ncbi:MAG TPA: hypothetical protein VIR33_17115, partial [Thermopolyspora sp.]
MSRWDAWIGAPQASAVKSVWTLGRVTGDGGGVTGGVPENAGSAADMDVGTGADTGGGSSGVGGGVRGGEVRGG